MRQFLTWNIEYNFQIDAFAFVDPNNEFLQQFPLRRLPHYLKTICSARKFVGFTPRFAQYQLPKYTIQNTQYTYTNTKYKIQYCGFKPRFAQYLCRSLITTWHPQDLHLHRDRHPHRNHRRHLNFCIDFECHLSQQNCHCYLYIVCRVLLTMM